MPTSPPASSKDFADCRWPVWTACRLHDDAQITYLDGYAYIVQVTITSAALNELIVTLFQRHVASNRSYRPVAQRTVPLDDPDLATKRDACVRHFQDQLLSYHVKEVL